MMLQGLGHQQTAKTAIAVRHRVDVLKQPVGQGLTHQTGGMDRVQAREQLPHHIGNWEGG